MILDSDPVISHLEKVQGTPEKKQEFARLIIDEAARFKKSKLVERLNAWLTTQEQAVGQNSRNHVKKTVNR
jgi:nitrogen-specific signal transduction histidine kinase